MSRSDINKLEKLVLDTDGAHPHKDWVGKDAAKIARAIGKTVPESTRILLCEVDSEDHPFVQAELLMPLLALTRVKSVDDGIAALPTRAARARLLIDSYLAPRHRDNRGSGCVIVAVGADAARLRGPVRAGYSQAFTRHLDRLGAALRLSRDPEKNRDRVTHLMSSLVGALLFARATDDPARSDGILHSMRRMLRAEFCTGAEPAALSEAANDFLRTETGGGACSSAGLGATLNPPASSAPVREE